MSITKRQGIGGNSSTRRLAQLGERVTNPSKLDPNSRNGRRIMQKLRAKYGDEMIDREIERLNQVITSPKG
jgi:hypothetical protein